MPPGCRHRTLHPPPRSRSNARSILQPQRLARCTFRGLGQHLLPRLRARLRLYCYARPSHAYLDLSPGLDFETRLYAKTNAVELLRAELARPGYAVSAINIGANTDPYQPIERDYRLTRGVLEVFAETRHPCTIVTKNALIERDLDLLQDLARDRLVHCFLSVTTLDNRLASRLEPRASAAPAFAGGGALNRAGVPCGVCWWRRSFRP